MNSKNDKLTSLLGKLNFCNTIHIPTLDQFLLAHSLTIPTSVRLNPNKKNSTLELSLENEIPWESNGYYLSERPKFNYQPLFHAGSYYVQEASSMMTGYLFNKIFENKKQNLSILDLCAAPGGKSTHIASMLDNSSLLISNEVIQSRANILSENLSKWGQMNTWVTQLDPNKFKPLTSYFDAVIVDAPCTGSGLWRRDEKAMDEWSENNVKLCAERQKRILSDIHECVIPQGYIIYSTCSFSKEENEDIVDWFCNEFNYETIQFDLPKKNWNITQTITEKQSTGYRLAPWKLKGEGFFISVMQKKSEIIESKKKQKPAFQKKSILSEQNQSYLSKWFDIPVAIIEKNDEWYAIPTELKSKYDQLLLNGIRFKKTGTAIGSLINKKLVPNHELALSIHLNSQYPSIELDYDQAIKFLKKENIDTLKNEEGWHLVTYKGNGIGWGKWMKNRMNNYYPKNWRIIQ